MPLREAAPASFAAIILAAGSSTRMGTPKALLDAGGESFLDRLAGLFVDTGCAVYAVTGEHGAAIQADCRRGASVAFVRNPDPSRGQLSSLQCGLGAVPTGLRGVFFMPVDAPGIARQTVVTLMEQLGDFDFAIPVCAGRHGHPVLMRATCAGEFLAAGVDASARDILHAGRARTRFVDVDDASVLDDIDDPQTYARWRGAISGQGTVIR